MYAIVKTGGKQYKAEENAVLKIEKLDIEAGEKVELDQILLVSSDSEVKVGTPTVLGAKIIGKVLRHGKARKIHGFTYMSTKDSHRHYGHRQPVTEVLVEKIEF